MFHQQEHSTSQGNKSNLINFERTKAHLHLDCIGLHLCGIEVAQISLAQSLSRGANRHLHKPAQALVI
jgi:hypothetical protein